MHRIRVKFLSLLTWLVQAYSVHCSQSISGDAFSIRSVSLFYFKYKYIQKSINQESISYRCSAVQRLRYEDLKAVGTCECYQKWLKPLAQSFPFFSRMFQENLRHVTVLKKKRFIAFMKISYNYSQECAQCIFLKVLKYTVLTTYLFYILLFFRKKKHIETCQGEERQTRHSACPHYKGTVEI